MEFAGAAGVCVCAANAIPNGGGCDACADDEVVAGGACACAPGEEKNGAGVCAVVLGFGTPCTDSAECTNPSYDYCAVRGGVGTCTSQCAADTDCSATYVCADWEPTPSCRTFTGYGATCAAPTDCASYDSKFCGQGHCVVQGCTMGTDDCPRDTACCDFSNYGIGTLCVPAGSCS